MELIPSQMLPFPGWCAKITSGSVQTSYLKHQNPHGCCAKIFVNKWRNPWNWHQKEVNTLESLELPSHAHVERLAIGTRSTPWFVTLGLQENFWDSRLSSALQQSGPAGIKGINSFMSIHCSGTRHTSCIRSPADPLATTYASLLITLYSLF